MYPRFVSKFKPENRKYVLIDCLHFSIVTITTLGYGDITPLTPLAKTVSYMEAVTGQIYIAVLIARLVGLHIAHSMSKDSQ